MPAQSPDLEGQRALVTGATSGIGRAIAMALATQGAEVLVHGWAPHDRRATGSVPRNHGKNTTLAPTLRPGQVVVLDNLSVHKAASIRQTLEARHCLLLFLPPYSPDFTPIEQAFSTIKAILDQGHPARAGRPHQGGAPRGRSKKQSASPSWRVLATMRRPGLPMPGTLCLLKPSEHCSSIQGLLRGGCSGGMPKVRQSRPLKRAGRRAQ